MFTGGSQFLCTSHRVSESGYLNDLTSFKKFDFLLVKKVVAGILRQNLTFFSFIILEHKRFILTPEMTSKATTSNVQVNTYIEGESKVTGHSYFRKRIENYISEYHGE